MLLREIVEALNLSLLTRPGSLDRVMVTEGYASDLLSRVLAEAPHHAIWITLQAHANVVAVACVLELAAVVITAGSLPDQDTIARANEESVPLFATDAATFHVVGRLWELGVR